MGKPNLVIIGAGGVGDVAANKAVQFRKEFGDIYWASRSLEKLTAKANAVHARWAAANENRLIEPVRVNARNTQETVAMLRQTAADIVVNVASPYCNPAIMDACLETGTHYIDTALAEDEHVENIQPNWYGYHEWPRRPAFTERGVNALLGMGFDPGVVNIFCAHARKHLLDEIASIDIIDVNGEKDLDAPGREQRTAAPILGRAVAHSSG